jgi:regulator of sigma E protease
VTSFLAFVFVLGVLVFVHELGHFLAARRIGVRVLTFSLGFGPRLLSFRRGETEYCISVIPLGGYVKMAGENPEDTRTGSSDEFLSKSKWERFQVLVMGPIMNLALALIVMAVVLYQGAQVPAFDRDPVVVGGFSEESVAQAAGLRVGDHIVTVDGRQVPDWDKFSVSVLPKANKTITMGVERGAERLEISLTPKAVGKYEAGDVGILPLAHPQIAATRPGEPAQEAGLLAEDIIVSAGGEADVSRERVIELIKTHENKPLEFQVLRGGQTVPVTVTPRQIGDTVMIGATISPWQLRNIQPSLGGAVVMSVERNWEWTKLIVSTLVGLFTRDTSVKQLMGPVAIGQLSGDAAEQGWIQLFTLMAMISLNLGLLNLMPVPVLDGGHITILALEGLSRRDFSMKVKEKMLLAGFALLLTLMVTVIYNDLMRIEWIERLVPWR